MIDELLPRLSEALSARYRIEREVGRGGMATVLLAEDLRHGRPVAIKVMRPDLSSSLASERFLREIEVAAILTHPNILPLHDSGAVGDILYYVMPFVDGESLSRQVDARYLARRQEEQVAAILTEAQLV